MDPHTNSESRDRRREEALARRLGEALDRVAPSGPGPCPDAELIAAYHEQALPPEEALECETHFAACSRCRKILAVLGASCDTPLAEKEVARLGELVAAAQAPREPTLQTPKKARPSLLDWRMRWLAPALGVAAVLALWFAIRPLWHPTDQNSSGQLIAQAPKNEPVPTAEVPPVESSKAAPSKKPATDSDALKDGSLPRNRLDDGKVGVAKSESGNQKKAETGALGGVSGAVGGLGMPPPLPAPGPSEPNLQAQAPVVPQPALPEPRAAADASARAMMAPSARAAASADSAGTVGAPPVSGGPGRVFSTMMAATVLKSPSGAVSWRIGVNGRIERSTDGGRTWTSQTSPSEQAWLAGSAVSDTTCWIVGRNGAIARTADGEHWEQVAPPPLSADASGKLTDLISVTSSDAMTATITASDQRRYTTQDGGKTWRAQ